MKVRMITVTALIMALLLPGLLALTGCFEGHRERRDLDRHEERHVEHRAERYEERHEERREAR